MASEYRVYRLVDMAVHEEIFTLNNTVYGVYIFFRMLDSCGFARSLRAHQDDVRKVLIATASPSPRP